MTSFDRWFTLSGVYIAAALVTLEATIPLVFLAVSAFGLAGFYAFRTK